MVVLAVALALGMVVPAADTTAAPKISKDSVYALAVDSAKYRDQDVVWLLDYGNLKINPDGTHATTFRPVLQILTQRGAERYRELTFSYAPGHERLTVDWVKVVKPNGEIINDAGTHVQDADIPASMGDPVYSDRRVRRISLTGLEAGSILDYSYTTTELKPYLAGDFFRAWRVTPPGASVVRSYWAVEAPASFKLHMKERNLAFKRSESDVGGTHRIVWATSDVPRIQLEPFAPDTLDNVASVVVSGSTEWKDIAHWYAGLAATRYPATPTVRAKVAEQVAGAKNLDDSIARIHRWVAQDIRYVSISLGLGGYQPRYPDSVIATGYGDCKDKATLMISALSAIGVKAYPVLLHSFGRVIESLPSLTQFNHAIVVIEREDRLVYSDMTAQILPLGTLPIFYQGAFGLLIRPDGSSETIRFPREAPEQIRNTTTVRGMLDSAGSFSGWAEIRGEGFAASALRSIFANPPDSIMRSNIPRFFANQLFRNAEGDSLQYFNGKDFSAEPKVRVFVRADRLAQVAGNSMILPLSGVLHEAGPRRFLTELKKQAKRTTPLDLGQLSGPTTTVQVFEFTLPNGWRARLPANVDVDGALGRLSTHYSQNGNVLRIEHERAGVRGILPAQQLDEVLKWMDAASKDDAEFIILEKSG